MNKISASVAAGVLAAAGAAACAQSITTVTYDFPQVANGAFLFGSFGNGSPVSGFIVKTRVFLN